MHIPHGSCHSLLFSNIRRYEVWVSKHTNQLSSTLTPQRIWQISRDEFRVSGRHAHMIYMYLHIFASVEVKPSVIRGWYKPAGCCIVWLSHDYLCRLLFYIMLVAPGSTWQHLAIQAYIYHSSQSMTLLLSTKHHKHLVTLYPRTNRKVSRKDLF